MLIVKHGVLVTPEGQKRMDLGIKDGVIARMEECIEPCDGDTVVDALFCFVYPEFVKTGQELSRGIKLRELYRSAGIHRDLLLYSLITGETEVVQTDGDSETEERLKPGILMHVIGEAMDPYGYMKLLAENPARQMGLWPKKGAVAVGSDADLVIWDPNVKRTIGRIEAGDDASKLYLGGTSVGVAKYRIQNGMVSDEK